MRDYGIEQANAHNLRQHRIEAGRPNIPGSDGSAMLTSLEAIATTTTLAGMPLALRYSLEELMAVPTLVHVVVGQNHEAVHPSLCRGMLKQQAGLVAPTFARPLVQRSISSICEVPKPWLHEPAGEAVRHPVLLGRAIVIPRAAAASRWESGS